MRQTATLGDAFRAANPDLADKLSQMAREVHRDRREDRRARHGRPQQTRRQDAPADRRAQPQRMRPGPPVVCAAAIEPIGRLVIVTDTDLPCSLNVAVVMPGDHSGLVCAYLDSELYNHFGWWFEPPKKVGEPGGVVDLARFGAVLDVMPRDGAWRFQTRLKERARPVDVAGGRRGLIWSARNVGTSVLHIRFKGEIEAWYAARGLNPPGCTPKPIAPEAGGDQPAPEAAP